MNWIKIISERFTESSREQSWFTGLFSIIGMGIGCFAMVIALSVMKSLSFLNICTFFMLKPNGKLRFILAALEANAKHVPPPVYRPRRARSYSFCPNPGLACVCSLVRLVGRLLPCGDARVAVR